MTYFELYRYNHTLNALEDFSSLIPYERFIRTIYPELFI